MAPIQAPEPSTRPVFTTYREAVHRLLDQANQLSNDESVAARPLRIVQRAVKYANDNLATYNEHWKLYRGVGRVVVPGAYSAGTVVVDASAKTATLTGGMWPSWAWYGELHIGDDRALVKSRVSDTVLSLHDHIGDHSGSYQLFCATVPLNQLIRKIDSVFDVGSGVDLSPVTFDNISRYASSTPGASLYPSMISVSGDSRFLGMVGMHIQPPASSQRVLEFAYHRRPRPVVNYEVTGLVSVSGTTATFDESFLTDKHLGAVVEVDGEQRVIASVTNGTTAELDASWVIPDNSEFVLSDPLDALPGAMTEAMIRLAEKESARSLVQDKTQMRSSGFMEALNVAMAEDGAMTTPMSAVPWFYWGGLTLGEVDVA